MGLLTSVDVPKQGKSACFGPNWSGLRKHIRESAAQLTIGGVGNGWPGSAKEATSRVGWRFPELIETICFTTKHFLQATVNVKVEHLSSSN